MSDKITIPITQGALQLLANLAAVPGLCTSPADVYRVGKASDDHQPAPTPDRPVFDNPQMPTPLDHVKARGYERDMKIWAECPASMIVTTPQRDSLKNFLKTAIEKGALPCSKPACVLMDAFGLAPQD